MTNEHKDHIVLPGFKEGDIRVFQHVFEEYFPALCYFAERLIEDREEAEDIVLDIFTRLWQRKEGFETQTNIKAFLYISVRNTCLNFLKYRQRKTEQKKELQYVTDTNASIGYDYELINTMVMQEIKKQVDELPPQCRQVFMLIFFENLSAVEVAARMGISPKTVHNQKQKAVHLIRSELLKRKLFMVALFFQWIMETKR